MTVYRKWSRSDLLFLIETLMPNRTDKEHLIQIIQDDEEFIQAMLKDDRVFQRLMAEEEILLKVSPHLYFTVLLLRAQRDLKTESYTLERRQHQKVAIFDTHRVVELLKQKPVLEYLADMLSSFTRIQSFTFAVRARKGIWHKYRVSDFDINSLIRHCEMTDENLRFPSYKRIADVCLFLVGMFPDHIEARSRYPLSGEVRPHVKSEICNTLEDFEAYGRAFYRLAAEHDMAKAQKMDEVLDTLSENFILAEKPLRLLGDHYLRWRKHTVFGL